MVIAVPLHHSLWLKGCCIFLFLQFRSSYLLKTASNRKVTVLFKSLEPSNKTDFLVIKVVLSSSSPGFLKELFFRHWVLFLSFSVRLLYQSTL